MKKLKIDMVLTDSLTAPTMYDMVIIEILPFTLAVAQKTTIGLSEPKEITSPIIWYRISDIEKLIMNKNLFIKDKVTHEAPTLK